MREKRTNWPDYNRSLTPWPHHIRSWPIGELCTLLRVFAQAYARARPSSHSTMRKRRFSVEAASRPLIQRRHSDAAPVAATTRRPDPKSLLMQGKHLGKSFADVALDRSYVNWAFRESENGDLSSNLASFVQYVKDEHGGLLTVGKHKGKYFTEALEEDPQYAKWCGSAACPNRFKCLKDFAAHAEKQGERRQEGESFAKKCMICLEKPLGAAWVPCGHTVACYECATALDGRCPICRRCGCVQKLFVG